MIAQRIITPRKIGIIKHAFHAFFATKETKVKIGKYNINYIKVGHGAECCILTPGGLGTIWTNYRKQIEGLDWGKFTLVVWDPPGYGKSFPPEREFTSESYENDADVAFELMKILEIPKFSALGWSAGGSASIILAAKYPAAVTKLVVWATNTYILPSELDSFRSIRDINTWAKHLRDPMMEVYGRDRFPRYWARWVDCMSAALEAKMDICSEFLKDVICPTFILQGGQDPLLTPVHGQHIMKHIQNSVMHIYPNGKHDIHIQYSEDFNRRIQEFLLKSAEK